MKRKIKLKQLIILLLLVFMCVFALSNYKNYKLLKTGYSINEVKEINKNLAENFYFSAEDIDSLIIGSKFKYLSVEIEKVMIKKYLLFKNNNEENFEKEILLDTVDSFWIEYIKDLEYLRQGINLRSYKQVDPVQEFQIESSKMFNNMSRNIKLATVKNLLEYIHKNNEVFELV